MKPPEILKRDPLDTQTHVVYDKATGRILGRIRHEAAEECDHTDILASFLEEDDALVPAILETEGADRVTGGRHRVSTDGTVVSRPQLVLNPERDVLEGDGEDTVEITILAVDADGTVIGHDGPVQVTTSRGKLSTSRGFVDVEKGRSSIALTSTRETVERVELAVTSLDGSARRGTAVVRFD